MVSASHGCQFPDSEYWRFETQDQAENRIEIQYRRFETQDQAENRIDIQYRRFETQDQAENRVDREIYRSDPVQKCGDMLGHNLDRMAIACLVLIEGLVPLEDQRFQYHY